MPNYATGYMPEDQFDPDDHCEPPFICPKSGVACIRAFCEDYGCADKARVAIDANDIAAGSIHPDEMIPRLPRVR